MELIHIMISRNILGDGRQVEACVLKRTVFIILKQKLVNFTDCQYVFYSWKAFTVSPHPLAPREDHIQAPFPCLVPLQKGNHCTAVACFFLHTPISVLLSVERTIRQLSFLFCSRDSSRIPDHVSSDYLWKMNKSSTRVVFSYLELLTESCASGTCIRVIKHHFEDKEGVLRQRPWKFNKLKFILEVIRLVIFSCDILYGQPEVFFMNFFSLSPSSAAVSC